MKRIGHAVLGSPRNQETVRWFRETLGLVCSDDVYADEQDNIIGQFSRIDAGDEYVDHHAFFCMKNARAGLNHFSFEVQDIDDVFIGHEYLNSLGKYEHMWGIGRHLLGSQVFDYWADPWGRVHEHGAAVAVGHAASGEVPGARQSLKDGTTRPRLSGLG